MEVHHDEHPGPCRGYDIVKVGIEIVSPGLEDQFAKSHHRECRCKDYKGEEIDCVKGGKDTEYVRQVFRVKEAPEDKGKEDDDKRHQPRRLYVRPGKHRSTGECRCIPQSPLLCHCSRHLFSDVKSLIVFLVAGFPVFLKR